MIFIMTLQTRRNSRSRLTNWFNRLPGWIPDIVTVVLVLALISISVFQLFSEVPGSWLLAAFAVTISGMTILFLVDRTTSRETAERVEALHQEVSSMISENAAATREVPPDQIRQQLEALLLGASEWTFRGGSARWQRTTVLPVLAKVSTRAVPYSAQIINPFRSDLCGRYASYRRVLRGGASDKSDEELTRGIQLELFSFIFAVAYYAQSSRIEPKVTLIDTYSPLRQDGSNTAVMLTVADSSKAGLLADSAGWYFTSLKDEFNLHSENSVLALPKSTWGSESRTPAAARSFFVALLDQNRDLPQDAFDSFDDSTWEKLAKIAFEPEV